MAEKDEASRVELAYKGFLDAETNDEGTRGPLRVRYKERGETISNKYCKTRLPTGIIISHSPTPNNRLDLDAYLNVNPEADLNPDDEDENREGA